VERDDGVVIIYGFVNDKSVGRLLALQDRSTEISLCSLTEARKNENELELESMEEKIIDRSIEI